MAVESGFCSENFRFQDWNFHPFSLVENLHPQQTQFHFHSSSSSSCSLSSVSFSSMEVLNSELELQKQEMDFLLHFQNEKLRNAIEEQRKEQVKALISNIEKEGYKLMSQKEADLAEARRRGRELEEKFKKAETEKEAWKRMANAKEAMVMELHRKLEEARERLVLISNGVEDAESHYRPMPLEEEEAEEENGGSGSGSGKSALGCKSCKNRNPCEVLFLPCRHLCSCKYCEAFLGCCPVCHSVKEASVEVLLL